MKNQYIIKVKEKYIRSFKDEAEITGGYFVTPVKLTPNNNNVDSSAIFGSPEEARTALDNCIKACDKAYKRNERKVKRESRNNGHWKVKYFIMTFSNWKRMVNTLTEIGKVDIIEYKPEVICKKKKSEWKPGWNTNVSYRSVCSICNINFVHKHAFELKKSVYICPHCILKLAPAAKQILEKCIEENPDYMQDYNSELITGHL